MLSVIVSLLTVLIDQLTKIAVDMNFEIGKGISVIKNVLNITYVKNEGMAFGLFSDNRIVFMLPTVVLIVGIGFAIFKLHGKNRIFDVAAGLVLGGGVGNMIDRVFRGFVIDFVDFNAFDFWKWVFNFADMAVAIGVVLFGFVLLKDKDFLDSVEKKNGEKNE